MVGSGLRREFDFVDDTPLRQVLHLYGLLLPAPVITAKQNCVFYKRKRGPSSSNESRLI